MIIDQNFKFSYSSISLYIKCQRAFYYRYIEKVEAKKGNVYQYVSSIIHFVLEDMLKRKLNNEEIGDEYNLIYEIMKSNPPGNIEYYKYDDKKVFDEIVNITKKLKSNINDISYMYNNVKDKYIESDLLLENEKYKFIAKPDYIFINDKGIYLYDFKIVSSFKSMKNYTTMVNDKSSPENIRQHDIYSYCFEKKFNKKIDNMYYLFVFKNPNLDKLFLPFKIKINEFNFSIVENLINEIKSKNNKLDFKINIGHCNNCYFNHVCNKEFS